MDADGRHTPEHQRYLAELQAAAVAAEDFGRAQHIQTLRRVLDPANALTPEQCAPETPEEQASFFFRNGFVILRGCLEGEALARCQSAWSALESHARPAWEEARSHCSGIARHGFKDCEEGWFKVSRKWYGMDDARLQPGADPNSTAPPFCALHLLFVHNSVRAISTVMNKCVRVHSRD